VSAQKQDASTDARCVRVYARVYVVVLRVYVYKCVRRCVLRHTGVGCVVVWCVQKQAATVCA
jgi:hypothetical protein